MKNVIAITLFIGTLQFLKKNTQTTGVVLTNLNDEYKMKLTTNYCGSVKGRDTNGYETV